MGLVAVLLVPLMLVAGLLPAQAAPLGPGVTIYPAGYGAVHLGPSQTPQGVDAGEPGFCTQARIYSPDPGDTIASTAIFNDPVLAYIYAAHRHATDDATAAAVGYETHMRGELPGTMAGGDVDTVRALIADATPQFVKDRVAQLVAEAEAAAGPWQSATAPTTTGSGTRTGIIVFPPIIGRGGAPLVGYPMTATLAGPATLDATGTKTWTGTTSANDIVLAWTAEPGANGEVTGSRQIRDLPRQTLTYVHPSGQRQAQLTYGLRAPSDPQELTVPGPTFRAVGDFRPQGVSSAPAFVDRGEDLVDTFVPRAHPEDVWVQLAGGHVPVTYSYDVYDVGSTPVPESASAPSGAPVFSGTAVASGPEVPITVNVGPAPTASSYVWVWGTSKALQPAATRDYVRDVVWTDGTKLEETTVSRWDITHWSQTREYNVVPGGRVFDTIEISGMPDDHTQFAGLGRFEADVQHADVTVYGPLEARPTTVEVLEGTPVFWHDTIPAVNGTHEVGWDDANPIIAPAEAVYAAGDYFVFVYSFDGDARVAPYTSPFNDLREAWYVPVDRTTDVETWLITDADQEVTAGQPFGDTALLTGTIVEGGHLQFEAYGVFTEDLEPVESGEHLLWTSEPIPVHRAGVYRSGYTTADLPEGAAEGFVYWVATYYDADGDVVVRGEFGDASEITRLLPPVLPEVTTLATPMVALGDPAHDVAYVSGPVVPESTLTWRAFRQADSNVVDDDELVAEVGPKTIYHGGTYRSPEVVFDEVGTYYWVETLTSPDGTVQHVGEPRLPDETTRVVRVTTEAVLDVVLGEAASDVAFIQGDVLPGTTIGFSAYRQSDSADVADDELVAELAPVEVPTSLDEGDGVRVRSGVVVFERVGTYYWVETLIGPNGSIVHVGEPRLPNETTTVHAGAEDMAAAAVDEASALAVTGAGRVAALFGAAALLALGGGSMARWSDLRKRACGLPV
jgi:hypothetical protein